MFLTQFSALSHREKLNRLRSIAMSAISRFGLETPVLHYHAEHSNILYRVVDGRGRRYMLKIARPGDHSAAEQAAVLHWLHELHAIGDVPIVRAIKGVNGELLVDVEPHDGDDVRLCGLFEWLPGVTFTHRVSVPLSFAWGRLMAAIHNASETVIIPESGVFRRWDTVFYWDPEVLFEPEYQRWVTPARYELFRRVTDRVSACIDRLWESNTPPILIHGDLHPHNIKVHQGRLTALDVEDVMWGLPVQDIAIALLYVSGRVNFTHLRKAFTDGYSSLRPWPDHRPGDVETLFIGRQLMFANFLVSAEDEDPAPYFEHYESTFREFLRIWP